MIDNHTRHLPLGRYLIGCYLIGRVLSFCSKPAHIRYRCIGSIFNGENIITTYLLSILETLKASAYAVLATTQTKALRESSNGYCNPSGGHDGDA